MSPPTGETTLATLFSRRRSSPFVDALSIHGRHIVLFIDVEEGIIKTASTHRYGHSQPDLNNGRVLSPLVRGQYHRRARTCDSVGVKWNRRFVWILRLGYLECLLQPAPPTSPERFLEVYLSCCTETKFYLSFIPKRILLISSSSCLYLCCKNVNVVDDEFFRHR